VAPFGIRLTLVEPGPFRTKMGGRIQQTRRDGLSRIMPRRPAGVTIARITDYGAKGTQPGDPDLAAAAMIKVVDSPNPPLHFPLGALAIGAFRAKLDTCAPISTHGRRPVGQRTRRRRADRLFHHKIGFSPLFFLQISRQPMTIITTNTPDESMEANQVSLYPSRKRRLSWR